jgi:hypothetical protein
MEPDATLSKKIELDYNAPKVNFKIKVWKCLRKKISLDT